MKRIHGIGLVISTVAICILSAGFVDAATRTWTGTDGSDWFNPANWDPDTAYPQANDTVVVNTGSILLTNETAALTAFSIINATLTFSNWNTRLRATTVTIESDATLTLPAAYTNQQMSNRVWIVCSDLMLAHGGEIDVSLKGYAGALASEPDGSGSGAGVGGTGGSGGWGSGGGYGGRGGDSSVSRPGGAAYGTPGGDAQPGSGGGGGAGTPGTLGGNGGGAVRIEADGTVTIQGAILADGGTGGSFSGGGSGGGVYIVCHTLDGYQGGRISGSGGNGQGSNGGGGGGGRIVLDYFVIQPGAMALELRAVPGSGSYDATHVRTPHWGSIWLSDTNLLATPIDRISGYVFTDADTTWSFPSLSVSNAFLGAPGGYTLDVAGDVWIGPNGRLQCGQESEAAPAAGFSCGGNLTLTNAGIVRLYVDDDLTVPGNLSLAATDSSLAIETNAALAVGGTLRSMGVIQTRGNLDVGGDLILTNGAVLRVISAATNGLSTDYGLLVSVTGDISVAASSWIEPLTHSTDGGAPLFRMRHLTIAALAGINASQQGYAGAPSGGGNGLGPGHGKGTTTANGRGGGGGYGGKGGDGSGSFFGGAPYGDVHAAGNPGSGGGGGAGPTPGGWGGGRIRMHASGTVSLHGSILADGGSGGNFAGGGSGGGVFIACQEFSGAGGALISAKGGNSHNASGGGGGGGRISIAIGLSDAQTAQVEAGEPVDGLVAYDLHPDYAGTISVTNGAGYYSGEQDSQPGTRQFLKISPASDRMMSIIGEPSNYGTPAPLWYSDWTVTLDDVITNWVATPVNELAGQRWSSIGWRLTDKDSGVPITQGASTQAVFTVTTNHTLVWRWTNEYRLAVSAPHNGDVNPGDVDGWHTNGTVVTGIEAEADPGYYFLAWVGADVPPGQEFSNPLTVTMDRPRTNVFASFASLAGETKIWSGTGDWTDSGRWSPPGMPGSNDYAILQSGTVTLRYPVTLAGLAVSNTLVLANWDTCVTAAGDVWIGTGGLLTLPPAFDDAAMSNRVWIVCSDLTVSATGAIDVSGKGYAGATADGANGFGPGFGTGGTGGHGGYGSGGGYGGRGGDSSNAGRPGGSVNGSLGAAANPGSGGGGGAGTPGTLGGHGGGAVYVDAAGTVTIDGSILANGGKGGSFAGGGSGGGIHISCRRFEKTAGGQISAAGADGTSMVGSGGGGGGRIAIWIGSVHKAVRHEYPDAYQSAVYQSDNVTDYFSGTVSVSQGVGLYNLPDDPDQAAYPGTAYFFTMHRGSIFMFR